MIDQILGSTTATAPFEGAVDPQRIGVMGLSLGGMTATLAAFHPRLRDARIRAAVSIAGPMTIFGTGFLAITPIPFLMLAGDEDVVIDYATNAPLVLERVPDGRLVTIHGGNHVGFDDSSTGVLRALPIPMPRRAAFCCLWTLDLSRGREPLAALGGPEAGLVVPSEEFPPLLGAGAVHGDEPRPTAPQWRSSPSGHSSTAYFTDEAARAATWGYLRKDLGRDFPEARYAERTAITRHRPLGCQGHYRCRGGLGERDPSDKVACSHAKADAKRRVYTARPPVPRESAVIPYGLLPYWSKCTASPTGTRVVEP